MSYTTDRQPQGILKNSETFLREAMISELVAINDYSSFLQYTSNKDVIDVFHHIMNEEKEHYGLFLEALRTLDVEENTWATDVNKSITITSKKIYTDYPQTPKENRSLLLTSIRDAIKAELETIILYNYFVENTTNKNLSLLINAIAKDEKEHVEELTKALVLLDKDKYGPITF